MAKTQKHLSRRQREEQRQMRRFMIFGGAAAGIAAAAGVGVTLLPPSFPQLKGPGSIDDRLKDAGISDQVIYLTPKAAETSIMVIGTTDCVHCRAFVKNGLDDAIAFAGQEGLGLVYAPTGNSRYSLASTRLINAFARAGKSDPEIIRAVYDHSSALEDDAGLAAVARKLGERFGLSETEIAACLSEEQLAVASRIQALSRAFPIEGTPMFFVQSAVDREKVLWFSGFAGEAAIRRQVSAARTV